jgi:putative lipoic acid-binding regulatory protein
VKEQRSLLQFPCSYPLKVLGLNGHAFHATVSAIIEKHVAEGDEVTYSTRVSSGDNYMSITATFIVKSREQLNAIYEELNQHELVLITL